MMRWLLTYADMITLLLAFFIVLYSIAKVDQERFQQLARQLQTVFSGGGGLPAFTAGTGVLNSGTAPLPSAATDDGSMPQLIDSLQEFIDSHQLSEEIAIEQDTGEVTLRLSEVLLFESGEASLTPEAREALEGISEVLNRFPNPIRIEGHTDNAPISNARYPSNWHLSAARAASVAQYLVERSVAPGRVTVVGYGEFRPVAPNDTRENRQRNRRVDIVVLGDVSAPADAPLP